MFRDANYDDQYRYDTYLFGHSSPSTRSKPRGYMPEEMVYVDLAAANNALGVRPSPTMIHGDKLEEVRYGSRHSRISPRSGRPGCCCSVTRRSACPTAAPIEEKTRISGSKDVRDDRRIVDVVADSTTDVLGDVTAVSLDGVILLVEAVAVIEGLSDGLSVQDPSNRISHSLS